MPSVVEIPRFDGHEGHAHGVALHQSFMRLDLQSLCFSIEQTCNAPPRACPPRS